MTSSLNNNVCAHIKRTNPDNIRNLSKEKLDSISQDFRVLPAFEKQAYDYLNTKHYSLTTNALLACRWREKLDEPQTRTTPFKFPSVKDEHYYNQQCRYMPSQSMYNRPTFRKTLSPGPGVDYYGQRPIPDDLHVRKTKSVKKPEAFSEGRKKNKNEKKK